jgi:hypothetical protein
MPKIRTTLYIEREIWKGLLEIADREGSSGSEIIERKITPWVTAHRPGNPQQALDLITKTGKPYVAPRKCYRKHCPNPAVGTAVWIPTGKEYAVCAKHLKEMQHNRKWQVTDKKVGE